MTMLSQHFSLEELTTSETADRLGIRNDPCCDQLDNLTWLAQKTLEPIRVDVGRPVFILSGLRVEALNRVTPGSSPTSQHRTGEAADIRAQRIPVAMFARMIAASPHPFDQLILEYADEHRPMAGWCHVSNKRHGINRREILHVRLDPFTGKPVMEYGLPSWALAMPMVIPD